ncbi:hypothetical protein PF005_g26816 [Phytophthora fragariae]|uniref:Uncharacterized protein n=1 Tax=Phytophthora fragariae TaxID=53985 RepID=A0A6A3Q8J3_9STRA|nr:hypothetical protein PF003_g34909 [Phytophthora fragariae]KAE8924612.1 hypothetical protein PF009_g25158 [Phytophthora fragariae]KAE8990537.1 hypothetical protein PF011_g18314 [Phytophthora fragariae]KAE9070837.1 hypothetical protein PF007_g26788 [Phytophthora fragariae]KAE9072252.1 hypothetical protein PF010_g25560 [Phytophthora fragariae]
MEEAGFPAVRTHLAKTARLQTVTITAKKTSVLQIPNGNNGLEMYDTCNVWADLMLLDDGEGPVIGCLHELVGFCGECDLECLDGLDCCDCGWD